MSKMSKAINALESLWLESCKCTEATSSEDCPAHIKMLDVRDYIMALEADNALMREKFEEIARLYPIDQDDGHRAKHNAEKILSSLVIK